MPENTKRHTSLLHPSLQQQGPTSGSTPDRNLTEPTYKMGFIAVAMLFAACSVRGFPGAAAANHASHCMATNNVFELSLDVFASEWGAFKVLVLR